MPESDELGFLGILKKKKNSWDLRLDEASCDLDLDEFSWV